MPSCCVVGCTNRPEKCPTGTKFYCFPKVAHKRQLRKLWIQAVRRENPDGTSWQPSRSAVICSTHFSGGVKVEHPDSPSFVPTIFPLEYGAKMKSVNPVKKSLERFQQARSRKGKQKTDRAAVKWEKTEAPEDEEPNAHNGNVGMSAERQNINAVIFRRSHDKQIQCDFLETENGNNKVFVCNRKRNGPYCEAQTQTCIPLSKIDISKHFMAGNSCGSDHKVEYVGQIKDEYTGINEHKIEFVDKIKDEFNGMTSHNEEYVDKIKDEYDGITEVINIQYQDINAEEYYPEVCSNDNVTFHEVIKQEEISVVDEFDIKLREHTFNIILTMCIVGRIKQRILDGVGLQKALSLIYAIFLGLVYLKLENHAG